MAQQRNFSKKKQLILWFVCMMMLIPAIAWAQSEEKVETFTVSGVIMIEVNGDILLRIMNKEQYEKSREEDYGKKKKKSIDYAANKDVTGFLVLKVGEKEMQEKKVSFVFENVPKGMYFIEGFQDMDGDGLLWRKRSGHKREPTGRYRYKKSYFGDPDFEDQQFEVNQNITDIQMDIKPK